LFGFLPFEEITIFETKNESDQIGGEGLNLCVIGQDLLVVFISRVGEFIPGFFKVSLQREEMLVCLQIPRPWERERVVEDRVRVAGEKQFNVERAG
jgi:hypothetical protein